MTRCDRCTRARRIVTTDRDGLAFCAECSAHLTRYIVAGEARRPDGSVARMCRVMLSTPVHCRADALALLAKRRDRGAPWYGDQIRVYADGPGALSSLYSSVSVDVPWPTLDD